MLINGWLILSKWRKWPLAKVANFRFVLLRVQCKLTLRENYVKRARSWECIPVWQLLPKGCHWLFESTKDFSMHWLAKVSDQNNIKSYSWKEGSSVVSYFRSVDRTSATETVVMDSIPDRIKPKTIKIGIHSFPASLSALKGILWSLYRVWWIAGSLTRRPKGPFADSRPR